ncbi:hypothetical protein PR202_ga24737 [Eleusine coracana subsp. coracana]|uniref:Uncharacterized protein n=1 Tax=Eleusine coracana subsp. coracana TaxID=191504 RepID=A0AAV5D8H8_ELECO|nr:hypothetical protein PR202_ga24737 [Eleusine coracana subsp. coracana]
MKSTNSSSGVCPSKSGKNISGVCLVTGKNKGVEHQSSTGNAEQTKPDPQMVPAKCPFGYDSGTFKLGPPSSMICQALLHQCSKCTPCFHSSASVHARIKRSNAVGKAEVPAGKGKVINDDDSMERGAFLVQQAMRCPYLPHVQAFRAQYIESAKSRLTICAEDIREELKSSEDNLDLCSQLGAVLGMLRDC